MRAIKTIFAAAVGIGLVLTCWAQLALAGSVCINNQGACSDNLQDSAGTAQLSGNGLNAWGALYVDGGMFVDGGTTLNGIVTVGGVGGARQITLNATGSIALIGAVGTNQSFNVSPTGSGSVTIGTGATPEVNQLLLTPSATGTATTISVGGSTSDGDAGIILAPGDAGVVWIGNGVTGAGQVNHFVFAPQATGTAPILSIAGDTNQTLLIDPAGTGAVQIGSGAAAQADAFQFQPQASGGPVILTNTGPIQLAGVAGTKIGTAAGDNPITHVHFLAGYLAAVTQNANTGSETTFASGTTACGASCSATCICTSANCCGSPAGVTIANLASSVANAVGGITVNDTCTLGTGNIWTQAGLSIQAQPTGAGTFGIMVQNVTAGNLTTPAGVFTLECHTH